MSGATEPDPGTATDRTDEGTPEPPEGTAPSILVAGIGNIFLGDDGFGVEVARRLEERSHPPEVTVRDFGISGLDLAYELEAYEVAIFVDAVPGDDDDEPGTLYLIDALAGEREAVGVDTHGMDPASVLAFARAVGPMPDEVYVVGCRPGEVPDPDAEELVGELSEPVRAAVDGAIAEVEDLIRRTLDG